MKWYIFIFTVFIFTSCHIQKGIIFDKTQTEYKEVKKIERDGKYHYETRLVYGYSYTCGDDGGYCFHTESVRVYDYTLVSEVLYKNNIDYIIKIKDKKDIAAFVCPVDNGEIDNETWINWANGLWTGISEGDTLQFYSARAEGDEKHICPLQLGTIERCIKLYSNPGETVLTPFLGILAARFSRLSSFSARE